MRKKLFTLLLAIISSTSVLFAETCKDNFVQAPKIITTSEHDTPYSGTIRLYDKYCTSTTYVGWGTDVDNRRSDPYDYNYTLSSYDYFTLNGKMYNIHSSSNGEYNDMKYQGKTDIPSYIIENLSSGFYRLVFYTDCDSVVEQLYIDCYGVNIDGIYYSLDNSYDELYVTYRGTSSTDYDEYSGDIIIPETVSFHDKVYPIRIIGTKAFDKCQNLNSVTLLSADCQLTRDYVGSGGIYAYSGLKYGFDGSTWMGEYYVKYTTIPIYVPFGSLESYKQRHPTEEKYGLMNFHIFNKAHITSTTGATSVHISFGNAEDQKHIVSCGLEDRETFTGYIAEYVSLEPNSEYQDMPFFINTREGEYDTIHYSFTTTALELATKPSKPVSSTTAILLAETNMSDAEVNCGFEYKRNDAPADMEGTKVFCPVANGQMAGRLKNLKDDVYYKYRAFYQSKAGNMYYGDWQYIFTGDVAVEFDPILYTYGATVVQESEATISGYALAGSEDFTEQGFEYWAESRANGGANAPLRMAAAIGEHKFMQASGIKMSVTLTNLDEGTIYKYRAYGKVGDQYYYGADQTFTTQGEWHEGQGIEDVRGNNVQTTKILHNGQIFILRGEKVYTLQGQEVR